MGFGVTGFVKAITQKALIRYLDPDSEEFKNGKTLKDLDAANGEQGYLAGIYSSYKQSFLGIIQEIKPDVKKNELHKYKSTVTQYAVESGAIFSQHIVQQPIKVSLLFEETNAGKMIQNIVGGIARYITGTSKKSMFEQLVDIWERKIPVEIVTDNKIYKNMVIESLPIMQKAPYKGALQVSVDFTQLTTYQIKVNEKKGITNAINKSANAVKSGGKQQLENINNKPTAAEISAAQSRINAFPAKLQAGTATEDEIRQQFKDVEYLKKNGY